MKNPKQIPVTCPHCGHEHPADLEACPNCGTAIRKLEASQDARSEWARSRDSLKTQWVASVIAFWVSAAVLAIVFVIQDKLNLILLSIVLGMLLIGMWLKTRYHLHLRNEPRGPSTDIQTR